MQTRSLGAELESKVENVSVCEGRSTNLSNVVLNDLLRLLKVFFMLRGGGAGIAGGWLDV